MNMLAWDLFGIIFVILFLYFNFFLLLYFIYILSITITIYYNYYYCSYPGTDFFVIAFSIGNEESLEDVFTKVYFISFHFIAFFFLLFCLFNIFIVVPRNKKICTYYTASSCWHEIWSSWFGNFIIYLNKNKYIINLLL